MMKKLDRSCLEMHHKDAATISSLLGATLVTYMKMYKEAGMCPTCALFAISTTLGLTFKENTSVEEKEIVEIAISAIASSFGIRTEIVNEGHIH